MTLTHWVTETPTLKHVRKAETHFWHKSHPSTAPYNKEGNLQLLNSGEDTYGLNHTPRTPTFKAATQETNHH